MAEAKELSKKSEGSTEVATNDLLDELFEQQGKGTEEMSADDISIPYLKILQDLSPEVKKREPEYVEGAEPSFFMNSASKSITPPDVGLYVLPLHYHMRYAEWVPRASGGGLVNDYGTDDSILKECETKERKHFLPNGNEIVPAATHYVFEVDPETGAFAPAIISLSSTQLKKSRQWNYMMKNIQASNSKGERFNPPSFYMLYHATSIPESNKSGSWYGWNIKQYKPITDLAYGVNIFRQAKELRKAILEGAVKAAPPEQAGNPADDDIPF